MRCDKIRDLLMTDHIDGELKGAMLKAVEDHVNACSSCRKVWDAVKAQRASFGSAKNAEVPPVIWKNIQAAIVEEGLKESAFAVVRRRFSIAIAGAAVTIMLFAAIFGGILFLNRPSANGYDLYSDYSVNGELLQYDLGSSIEQYFL